MCPPELAARRNLKYVKYGVVPAALAAVLTVLGIVRYRRMRARRAWWRLFSR